MKHHCHCGFKEHQKKFRAKKLGLIGIVLMGLHLMLHVVECLLLPTIMLAFSGHAVEENASALNLDKRDNSGQSMVCQSGLTPSVQVNGLLYIGNQFISSDAPCKPRSNLETDELMVLLEI